MSKSVLIRDLPSDIKEWIDGESHRQYMSKNEFMLSLLKQASISTKVPTLSDDLPPAEAVIPNSLPFTFIDLFAGIGGFRIGLSRVGGRCLWTSEYDTHSQRTYKAYFGEENIFGDINELKNEAEINKIIPDHDILAAGFPCQPFSIAGVSKKKSLGHLHGFKCKKQGNLFFKIVEIVNAKRPPVLFLENVKNLKSHDKKRTWEIICTTLSEELNYKVFDSVLDASYWVPQHRERICIVCFDRKVFGNNISFRFPDMPKGHKPVIGDILEKNPPAKYTLTNNLWNYLQNYAEKHRKKGNGFGYGLVGPKDQSRTLSARYYKDGSEVLIKNAKGGDPRRLTITEAARLMGFDKKTAKFFGHSNGFPQVVSDTQAYKQFGNAVVPRMVEVIGREIVKTIKWYIEENGNGCLIKNRIKSKNNIKKNTVE